MSEFIAMNRFKIVPGKESEFEQIWKTRNTYLSRCARLYPLQLIEGAGTGGPCALCFPYPLGLGECVCRTGLSRKPFAKPMKEQVTGATSTSDIQISKGSPWWKERVWM